MTPTIANLSDFEILVAFSSTALSSYSLVTFGKTLITTIRFLVHSLTKSNLHILMYILVAVKFLWPLIKLISFETSLKYPRVNCFGIQFSLISIQDFTHYVAGSPLPRSPSSCSSRLR